MKKKELRWISYFKKNIDGTEASSKEIFYFSEISEVHLRSF